MKKLILISILLFANIAYAEEIQLSTQDVTFDSNKATISIQKQPMNTNSTQKAEVKNNWFCIVVQCNGKVPYDKTDNK